MQNLGIDPNFATKYKKFVNLKFGRFKAKTLISSYISNKLLPCVGIIWLGKFSKYLEHFSKM